MIRENLGQCAPIKLVFEGHVSASRIAEMIEILSEAYGKNLHVRNVNSSPPKPEVRHLNELIDWAKSDHA